MSFSSSTVSIGASTKKSDYDRLLDNTKALKDEAITLNGVKTFQSIPIFSNGVVAILHVQGQKGSGVTSGTFTSGSFIIRELNTEIVNTITGASLSSSQITLPAGIYRITAWGNAYKTDRHQTRFENVTDAISELPGSPEYSATDNDTNTRSRISGVITIAATKVFELQHRCEVTRGTFGYGLACDFGIVNVNAEVFIEKIG